MTSETLIGGRFRLADKIGAGGMGTVYRAHDTQTGFALAVKLFDARSAVDIRRAQREVQSLARLAHPAIVAHIADGVTDEGQLFLAMEWIEGTTVADRLDGEGFSLREVVAIARRIASALAAAHSAGIVHRDLKPSNVLLPDGRPETAMLIDFGIAHTSRGVGNLSLTRTGVTVGTPGYMAPEQVRGSRTLTPACDVFGLGCTLYECATGQPAFAGGTTAAILAKIVFADVVPIHALCPDAPRALSDLIAGMMTKPLDKRIPDCNAVESALEGLGKIADGPRRRSALARAKPPARGDAHCMVMASHGHPDDVTEPPSAEIFQQLAAAAELWNAKLELLATGAVCAHLTGQANDATHRAACFALAVRRLLPGWTIAISSAQPDAETAVETGTALLTSSVVATIFRKMPGNAIAVDPDTAPMLAADFELAADGPMPQLLGPRKGS